MKKFAALFLAFLTLGFSSGELMARPGRGGGRPHARPPGDSHRPVHRPHYPRHRTHTSVGFMFNMTPGYYPYYAYPYYPAVIAVETAPVSYIQRSPAEVPPQEYWYYCSQPQGYYPHVPACQGPWQTVIPFSPIP